MSIIEILQGATEPVGEQDRTRRGMEAVAHYEEQVTAMFGPEFTDALLTADSALRAAEVDDAYERGFTNAFQLWLEVLSKYSSYPHL